MSYKKKKAYKSSIRSEVGYGGCSVLLMSPLIMFALLSSIMGIVSGFSTLALGYSSVGTTMIAVFSIVTLIFLSVGWLYIRRLRELYRRGRYLNTEQNRINQLLVTQSAEQRLMDKSFDNHVDTQTAGALSNHQLN